MEQDGTHGDGGSQKMENHELQLGKKKEKTKWAQGNGISNMAILFCQSGHYK
jgi:hypothetical protein